MKRSIDLGDRTIEYDLERKDVKNLNLRIKADQSVYVSAGHKISEATIDEFLKSKSEYIIKALDRYAEMARYAPKPKDYVNGETFTILGHDLRLVVQQGTRNHVESDEVYITLFVKDISDRTIKKRTMDNWLKKQCQKHVTNVCRSVAPKFQKYGVEFPDLRFRNMVSRWGSCQPKRKILTFNIALVEAPLSCIEYVVTHEFIHFLQPNHSREFYHYLNTFMPDWKERKKVLEKTCCYYE